MSSQIGMFDGTGITPRNTTLVQYGIQTEGSHYRAHVGYVAQHVYVFPTESGRRCVESGKYTETVVKTQGIETAKGFKVPTSHVAGLAEILIPLEIHQRFRIESYMSTGQKGRLATFIVAEMMKGGLIPLPVAVDITDAKALQISGTDIIIGASLHVQVKCDYKAGNQRYGGTGNLFLQTEECNPFRQY